MTLAVGAKYLALAVVWCISLNQDAKAQDCRGFLQAARKEIGSHVAALQRHEHEASDRLKGLDTRPFDAVLADARKTTAIIDNPASLKLEEGLDRCRNGTRPVRKICAERGRWWMCWRSTSRIPSPTMTGRASPTRWPNAKS